MGTNRCSDWIFLVNLSCVWVCVWLHFFYFFFFYLAVSAGGEQQQITEQLLMNHFIFTALDHQLPHLLAQEYSFQSIIQNTWKQCVVKKTVHHRTDNTYLSSYSSRLFRVPVTHILYSSRIEILVFEKKKKEVRTHLLLSSKRQKESTDSCGLKLKGKLFVNTLERQLMAECHSQDIKYQHVGLLKRPEQSKNRFLFSSLESVSLLLRLLLRDEHW